MCTPRFAGASQEAGDRTAPAPAAPPRARRPSAAQANELRGACPRPVPVVARRRAASARGAPHPQARPARRSGGSSRSGRSPCEGLSVAEALSTALRTSLAAFKCSCSRCCRAVNCSTRRSYCSSRASGVFSAAEELQATPGVDSGHRPNPQRPSSRPCAGQEASCITHGPPSYRTA